MPDAKTRCMVTHLSSIERWVVAVAGQGYQHPFFHRPSHTSHAAEGASIIELDEDLSSIE